MKKSRAAFPIVQTPGVNFNPGISERTYIATKAMQSLITSGLYENNDIPKVAYRIADNMIDYEKQ